MIRLLTTLFCISLLAGCGAEKELSLSDELAISVKDTTRAFSFTNKKYGQYYGETNSQFKDGWQGWTLREQRIFNDYTISPDNKPLDRKSAEAIVYPHLLKRMYEDAAEEFFFADSLDLIIITLKDLSSENIKFSLDGLKTDKIELNKNTAELDISNILPGMKLFIGSDAEITNSSADNGTPSINFRSSKDFRIILYAGTSSDPVTGIISSAEKYIAQKKSRIEKLLKESFVKTNNPEFDKALMWAKVSLDALITEQDTKGIFAGLPWFNNYWGRDTFISLPGATFVQGNFSEAREILLSFAKYQDANPSSRNYGRIPNRITLNESIYNTADGTPWFVAQSYNYFLYTNDTSFIREIYPAVKLAYKASAETRVDSYGFLTHADAETWMDAVGPSGPWSPRGNRANDIQALWYKQLYCTSEIANVMKDSLLARECLSAARKLSINFERMFVDTTNNKIYDRLTADGKADPSMRPNVFFVLNEPDLFSTSLLRLKILGNAMKELVFPYGVLSLSQNDQNFHPYHDYQPYYVKDAAYHNGIIWQWNAGPVIQTLCGFGKHDTAWVLTKEMTHQILNRGAVGTIAELMDAFPRSSEKEPRLSGTFSQAWSLAEYIRNFYQDYLGIKPDASRNALYLLPTLPAELENVEFVQKVGAHTVKVNYLFNNDIMRITLDGSGVKDSIDIGAGMFNRADANFQVKTVLMKNDRLVIEIPSHSNSRQDLRVSRNGQEIQVSSQLYNEPITNYELYQKLSFARPALNKNLPALEGPDYELLTNKQIKSSNPSAKTIIVRQAPASDEIYEYPTNPNFVKGILDLTAFTVLEDDENYYFHLKYRKLHNPGWHNEYGFQLTYSVICINGNNREPISKNVPANSGFVLPDNRAYSRIIKVGGGIEIADSKNKVLAAYIPVSTDIKNPLGDLNTSTISFSVPKKYIGKITPETVISVLTGAQDDHGGAGVGEFRAVEIEAGEWTGGGKKSNFGHNVYDVLYIN